MAGACERLLKEKTVMTKAISMLALAAALVPASLVPGGDKTPGDNKLAPLERFVGEWAVDGKWADGAALHARTVYTWGLAKKIVHAKTFVMDGDKEYQRYEGVMAWHPEKKSLYQVSFAFDGSVTEVLMETKDKDTLNIGWTPFAEGKPSKVRQVIRFLDNDRFQWTVALQDGEQWKQLIDATWKRKR
jgi:hypothetical protein